LSLGELIRLIDGSSHTEEDAAGGLLVCHWEQMIDWNHDPDEAVAFAWIRSSWYPELAAHYAQVASEWCEQQRRKSGSPSEEEASA
jgi:hypothetical protein